MVTLQDSLVSSSARVLNIHSRNDLEGKRQIYLGRSCWIVKDPVGLKYFRFQDEEYFILKQIDGTRSLDEIKDAFESEFPPQKITLEELQSFIGQLHQSNLIVAGVPNQGHELLKRRKKRRRREIIGAMSNILCIRFKGIDPDRILNKMMPWVRWFFHPISIYGCLFLMIAALVLLMVEFDQFRSKLPAFQQFFGPKNLIVLSIVLGFTKILHEFGHGLTCKYFGGECHEMGVMILVLTPCLYCNVSDSWMLPNKWHRAAIGVAGVFVECTLAALCTFLWWFSKEGMFHYICLNIMFISSISTVIFNINPLLRYDGYYILSDILEIPNLRQKATNVMTRKCSEWFLGMEQREDPFLPKRNQSLFAAYTVAAVMYRWVVMASILTFIYRFFSSYELKIIGQCIAAMSLWGLLVLPIWKVCKFFWVPGRIYRVKKLNFYLSLTGLFLIGCFIALVPLPYSVYSPLVLELRPAQVVEKNPVTGKEDMKKISGNVFVPKTGGRLVECKVRKGQQVKAGDLLAVLNNPNVELQIVELQGERKAAEAEFKMYQNFGNKMEAVARQKEIRARWEGICKTLEARHQELAQLELRAPIDGIVVSPDWKMERQYKEDPHDAGARLPEWEGTPLRPENINTMLAPGTPFCSIGDPKKLEAFIVIDQSKIDFINMGQKVQMKLEELPSEIFEGEIADSVDIEQNRMESVPIQLSAKGGGAVPTETIEGGIERPQSQSYRVRVDIDNSDERMEVGMTGRAKIKVAPQTLWRRFWRLVGDVFNFKF